MAVTATLHTGDCRAVMATLPAGQIDAMVTDPPYGLAFMGKEWDHGVPGKAFWVEALRVLKPGAHLLAFGGTRTYHRLTVAIEDAGFEIRDCLMWLYGSGFPKSHNLRGEWDGWGTALKPAWEPVILARKPLQGTVAANVAQHGTGALNVDGCRIPTNPDDAKAMERVNSPNSGRLVATNGKIYGGGIGKSPAGIPHDTTSGRWPANVALDDDAAAAVDAQSGFCRNGWRPNRIEGTPTRQSEITYGGRLGTTMGTSYPDTGGASRFFYVGKASRAERNSGLDGMPERVVSVRGGDEDDLSDGKKSTLPKANHHPTVKPVALMRWLVRLVTPPEGTVLDPFMGSGTTGVACMAEGFRFIGIDREPEYVEIARRRIAHAQGPLFAEVTA